MECIHVRSISFEFLLREHMGPSGSIILGGCVLCPQGLSSRLVCLSVG